MALSIAQTQTPTGGWYTTGATETITPVSWSAGDIIVVVSGTEDTGADFTACSGGGLTWNNIVNQSTGSNECGLFVWWAQAGSSDSSQTITLTKSTTSSIGGGYAIVITGGPTGVTGTVTNRNESATSVTPAAGDVVIWGSFDWSANNSNQTLTTNSGTATEHVDETNTSAYSINIGSWVGVSAGASSFGVTSYTGMKTTQFVTIVQAPTGGGATTMNPTTTDIVVSIQTATLTKGARTLAPATTNITFAIQTVTLTKTKTLAPTTTNITYTVNTPTVAKSKVMAPATNNLTYTINTPTLVKGARTLSPTTTDVTVTLNAPTLSRVKNLTPTAADVTFTINTPTVIKGARTLSPAATNIAVTINTPGFSQGRFLNVTTTNVTVTVNTPTLVKTKTLSPATQNIVSTINTPSVVKTKAMAPATQNVTYVINTPTVVKGGRTFAPTTTNITYVINTPTFVKGAKILSPATQNITYTINLPVFVAGNNEIMLPSTTNITFVANTPTLVKGAKTLAAPTTNITVTFNLTVMTTGSNMAIVEHDVVFRQVEATEASITYGTSDSSAVDKLNKTLAQIDGWYAYIFTVIHGNHGISAVSPGSWLAKAGQSTGPQNTEVTVGVYEKLIIASEGQNAWTITKTVAQFKWYAYLLVTSERLGDLPTTSATETGSSLTCGAPVGTGDWQSWLFVGKNSGATTLALEKSAAGNFVNVAQLNDSSASSVKLGGLISCQTIASPLSDRIVTTNPSTICDMVGIQLAFQGDETIGSANAAATGTGDVTVITANLPVVVVDTEVAVHRMQLVEFFATSSGVTDWSLTGSPPSWVTLSNETSSSAKLTLNHPSRATVPGVYNITLRATNASGNKDTAIALTCIRSKAYAHTSTGICPVITPSPEMINLPFEANANALVRAQGSVTITGGSSGSWRSFVPRSNEELALADGTNGFPGGHVMYFGGPHEQVWHTVIRHPNDSNVLVGVHDVGGAAVSLNGGRSWRYISTQGKLATGCPGGVCFDPDSYAIFAFAGGRGIEEEYDYEGLYYYPDVRDANLVWDQLFVLHVDERLGGVGDGGISSVNPLASSRWGQDTFIYNPHTDNEYFFMVDSHGLYRMIGTYPGLSIQQIWNTSNLATVRDTYRLLMHPTIPDTLFISCRGASANAGKVWRLTNLTAPTPVDISLGLPNFGTTPDGDTSMGCLWIDFINPLNPVAAGNAMIASAHNHGLYYTSNAMAATPSWSAWSGAGGGDPKISRVSIDPYNINRWIYLLEEGEFPNQQYSNDAGVTRSNATVAIQNWPHFADSSWKTTTGGRYSVPTWNPDVPGEVFHHNKAHNWVSRNYGQTWYPATDYLDGWNSGGSGRGRWDFHSNNIIAAAFHDHGAAISTDNGRSYRHLVTPNGAGSEKNTCNAIAKNPSSNAIVCGSGDHGSQELCYTPNYLTTPFALSGEAIKKNECIYYYNSSVVHAGNIRSVNGGATWTSLGNTTLSSFCELIDWCVNDREVLWYFRHYGTTNQRREVFRAIINPSNPAGALTVTSHLLTAAGTALSGSYFACDHNNRDIIYVVSGFNLYRWNGTTLTNLGVSSIPALSGVPANTTIGSIATDPGNSNIMMMGIDRAGIPWLFRTENLLSATPSWEDVTDFRPWGNMSLGIRPQTGETFVGTPQGTSIYPRSPGDSRTAEMTYDAAGVDQNLLDYTYKAPIQP